MRKRDQDTFKGLTIQLGEGMYAIGAGACSSSRGRGVKRNGPHPYVSFMRNDKPHPVNASVKEGKPFCETEVLIVIKDKASLMVLTEALHKAYAGFYVIEERKKAKAKSK